YRYGVSWGATRYGYQYSPALLERLTPERRKILQPIPPLRPWQPDEGPTSGNGISFSAPRATD
ncbi:MAG TPA: hypothetical protein VKF37_13890, partial [Chloroflexota bacterium]|nr:hypothetical protein [Chloroflexota bacterium]